MAEFVYYGAEWCTPCKMYWPKVQDWSARWGVELTKVDLSDGFIDDIQSVPTMDVIVDGVRKLRVTQWGPGTKRAVKEALS